MFTLCLVLCGSLREGEGQARGADAPASRGGVRGAAYSMVTGHGSTVTPPSPPYLAGGSTAVESSNPHTPPNFLRIAAWSKIFRVLLLYGHSPSTTVNLKRSLSHATIYLTGGGVYRYSRELGRLRVSTTRHGMETTETPCRPDDRCRWAPRHYAVSGEDDRSRRYLLIEGLCSITVLTDSKPA